MDVSYELNECALGISPVTSYSGVAFRKLFKLLPLRLFQATVLSYCRDCTSASPADHIDVDTVTGCMLYTKSVEDTNVDLETLIL